MKHINLKNTLLGLGCIAIPGIVLTLVRPLLSNTDSYIYMNWNLFLGFLPMLFAVLFVKKIGGKALGYLWFLLWIGFLPNAPYMITDFIHIAEVGPRSILWMDSIMLFSFAWAGMIAWLYSMSLVYGRIQVKSFIPIVSLLTAIGLYLGRYIRFNTWDILTKPGDIFNTVFDVFLSPLDHHPFLLFVPIFWIFLMLSYLGYTQLHRLAPNVKNQ